MQPSIPAYLDRNLRNRKGERWKDIPGLDGYFKVSNYGRIKRMEYDTVHANGVIYPERAMILKPYVHRQKNEFKGDYKSYLCIGLQLAGIRYRFMPARLVYHLFVRPINLQDRSLVIFYKDENPLNLAARNLRLATLAEKQKRIKELRRSPSPLHKLSRAEMLRRLEQARKNKDMIKPVSQYCFKGKLVQTFSSAAEAARSTGASACHILKVAKGGGISSGGWLWKYGKARRISTSGLKEVKGVRQSPFYQTLGRTKGSLIKNAKKKA